MHGIFGTSHRSPDIQLTKDVLKGLLPWVQSYPLRRLNDYGAYTVIVSIHQRNQVPPRGSKRYSGLVREIPLMKFKHMEANKGSGFPSWEFPFLQGFLTWRFQVKLHLFFNIPIVSRFT